MKKQTSNEYFSQGISPKAKIWNCVDKISISIRIKHLNSSGFWYLQEFLAQYIILLQFPK